MSRSAATALVLCALLLGSCGGDVSTAPPGLDGATPAVTDGPPEPDPVLAAGITGPWRRSSLPADDPVVGVAEAACREAAASGASGVDEPASLPLAVTDVRGEGVLVLVFADDAVASGCQVELDEAGARRTALFAVSADPEGPIEDGAVTLGAYEVAGEGSVSSRTIVVGRVGDGAVKVRAGFDDDTYVTAAMDNGWYAMWWRSSGRPAVIVASDNRNVAMGKLTPP